MDMEALQRESVFGDEGISFVHEDYFPRLWITFLRASELKSLDMEFHIKKYETEIIGLH